MKQTISKGEQWWKPMDIIPCLFGKFDEITITFTPNETMEFDYVDPETGQRDEDWKDWKKVFGGISLINLFNWINLFRRNRDAIMLGWRWNPTTDLPHHEATIYINDGGSMNNYGLLKVVRGTSISMTIKKVRKWQFHIYLYLTSQGIESVEPVEYRSRFDPSLYVRINGWYGGANNSKGPWGGAAPKDMEMEVEVIRK